MLQESLQTPTRWAPWYPCQNTAISVRWGSSWEWPITWENSYLTWRRKHNPLRDLLKKSNMWAWGLQQQQTFEQFKAELTTPPGFALYDPNAETLVCFQWAVRSPERQSRIQQEAYRKKSWTCMWTLWWQVRSKTLKEIETYHNKDTTPHTKNILQWRLA